MATLFRRSVESVMPVTVSRSPGRGWVDGQRSRAVGPGSHLTRPRGRITGVGRQPHADGSPLVPGSHSGLSRTGVGRRHVNEGVPHAGGPVGFRDQGDEVARTLGPAAAAAVIVVAGAGIAAWALG